MRVLTQLPEGYGHLRVVGSLSDVFGGADVEGINARLMPRRLSENFNALADYLLKTHNCTGIPNFQCEPAVTGEIKKAMKHHDPAIALAAQRLQADYEAGCAARRIRKQDWHLRVIGYFKVSSGEANFHIDGKSRVLTCYAGRVTEWLRNEDAEKQPDRTWTAKPGAPAYTFGPGDIWYQDNLSRTPFLHRSPMPQPGDGLRLLSVFDL